MATKETYDKETYTIDEYLLMEEQAEYKSEYQAGKIIGMSGGTLNHNKIGSNIAHQLELLLDKSNGNCEYYNNDTKIYIDVSNTFVYSDGMLVCGEVENAACDKNTIINPVLVIEVLSDSTEKYDRSAKFRKYCSLPSFKEYILIDQHQAVIDSLYRMKEGYWKMLTTIGLDKKLYINVLDSYIPMSKIYKSTQQLEPPQFKMEF